MMILLAVVVFVTVQLLSFVKAWNAWDNPDMMPQKYDFAPTDVKSSRNYGLPGPEELLLSADKTWGLTGTSDGYLRKLHLETGAVEDILTPKQFNPNLANEAICNAAQISQIPPLEFQCGRILGIKWMNEEKTRLVLVNAYFGIYTYDLETHELDIVYFKPAHLLNDVVVTPNGDIYWTESHDELVRFQFVLVAFGEPRGSVWKLEAATGAVTKIMDEVAFANGITLSADGTKLYVAECLRMQILTYDLATGNIGILIDELPLSPDNIHVEDDRVFVAGVCPAPRGEWAFHNAPVVDVYVQNTPPQVYMPYLAGLLEPYGCAVEIKLVGGTAEIKHVLFDNTMQHFMFAGSVQKLGNKKYLIGTALGVGPVEIEVENWGEGD